jgi:large repetitive protein
MRAARVLALAIALGATPAAAAEIDLGALAQCLSDSGATFYGAHWCPYCRKQKESFAGFAHRLPYVECYDGPRSEGMNARCKRDHVQSFPTWVYPDGSMHTGAKTPRELAAATGC